METYRRLESLLVKHLPGQSLSLFAMPHPSADGQSIDWTTTLTGHPVPINQMPADQRERLLEALDVRLSALRDLIAHLPGQDPDAGVLREVLQLPGEEYLYAVGNQPVMTMWGYRYADKPAYLPLNRLNAPAGASDEGSRRRAPLLFALLLPLILAVLAWFLLKPCEDGLFVRWLPQLVFLCPTPPERIPDPALVDAYVAARRQGEATLQEMGTLQDKLAEILARCPKPEVPQPQPEKPMAEKKPCVAKAQNEQQKKPPLLVLVFDTSKSMEWPADVPAKTYEGTYDRYFELMEAAQKNPLLAYQVQNEIMQLEQQLEQMNGRSKISRIQVAKTAVTQSLDAVPASVPVALITAGGCPSRSRGTFAGASARTELKKTVNGLPLEEYTSLADGISRAGGMIRQAGGEGSILVISDGTDSCDGNPCAVAQSLHASLPNVKINVVDIQGTGDKKCIALPSGGQVYKTDNVRQAVQQMKEATQAVRKDTECE